MRILDRTGEVRLEIREDFRNSKSQIAAMRKIAEKDPNAEIVGFDGKIRPVIKAKMGGAKEGSLVALFAGGRPAPVTKPMAEEWK